MDFKSLPIEYQISIVKFNFFLLVQSFFDDPIKLRAYVKDKTLTLHQCKVALKRINSFNSMDCKCCRKFDISKFQSHQVDKELEPILDIAQTISQTKTY